jgi:hypothetical protein
MLSFQHTHSQSIPRLLDIGVILIKSIHFNHHSFSVVVSVAVVGDG